LVLDEHGFGHHGTRTARTGESGDRGQEMEKQDGEVAHVISLSRSQNPRNAHEFYNSPATRQFETDPLPRSALHHASVGAEGELVCEDTALTLTRPSGKRPLSVLAAPLPPHSVMLGMEPPGVAVFVTDPDKKPPAGAPILRATFGLTRAEAELVLTLLEGASVQEAAARLGLATDTVRKRLKVVFQKTNTHRQSELMRLVLLTTLPRGA
jgi:DNA-binding CsgD family transcriptional regulator